MRVMFGKRGGGVWLVAVLVAVLVVAVAVAGCRDECPPVGELDFESRSIAGGAFGTNFDRVIVTGPTAAATGEPALQVNNLGAGAALDVQDGGTSVFQVLADGSVSQAGDTALTGDVSITGELQVAQATAATTATPAVLVNSSAAGSVLVEVRDAATPVYQILNGGAVSRTGDDSMTGDLVVTGAGAVSAPTAVATATPALVVDSAGVSNLLEVRDAATPVFTVNDGGVVVGNVLQYSSSGERGIAATASITGTGTVAHGLTTVTWAVCTLAEDPGTGGGDAATVSVAISGNTVTAKAWQDDATAATETEVDVNCWVVGTP